MIFYDNIFRKKLLKQFKNKEIIHHFELIEIIATALLDYPTHFLIYFLLILQVQVKIYLKDVFLHLFIYFLQLLIYFLLLLILTTYLMFIIKRSSQ